jgi:hypothetical protein
MISLFAEGSAMAKLKLKARAGECTFVCLGREAETLLRLIEVGKIGITPLDPYCAGPAFRLAAYCHDLNKIGAPIECELEPHAGGRHGRYRLTGQVVIVERNDVPDREAAV